MPVRFEQLCGSADNALAPHYSAFRVAQRLLLTGHSHQAWPDGAREGLLRAFTDAAEHVDRKWERAVAAGERVKRGYARLLDDDSGHYTLASSTHDLVVRLLSALPLARRPRVVTTDAEFHSVRRQLQRLQEEGLEVMRVPARPLDAVPGRLAAAVDDRTCAAMVSSVFYDSALMVRGLGEVLRACERRGAILVVDAYHSLNVAPLSLPREGLQGAYVVGGGYKYCQLGEGNAVLRIPADCALRPVITGWFSTFGALQERARPGEVPYGAGGDRFAGSTYDPASHYRGASVFDFFDEQGLSVDLLRRVSQHQVGLLAREFDALDLDPAVVDRPRDVPLERVAGFLALRAPRAAELSAGLMARGVMNDHRADVLRLGPAPYLSDAQLREAVGLLGETARALDSASG